MNKKYEIHSGGRVVSTQFSVSASLAVIDYVRSYGVKDEEITRLGVDCVSWAGARFRAALVPTESLVDAMRTAGLLGRMTRDQRDFLRQQIDARMRERLDGSSKGGPRPLGHASPPPRAKS